MGFGEGQWVDQHRLVIAVARGQARPLVVATQVGVHRRTGRSSFQAVVIGDGRPIVISDVDIPLPKATGWEIRTSGLWADHVCEQWYQHWSYGLEAFALAIDEPNELLGSARGDRVPLGWELEFEASEPPVLEPGPSPDGDGWYRQLGIAHGLLLSADGEREIEGRALRSHRWGAATFPPEVVLAGGAAGNGASPPAEPGAADQVALPGVDEVWYVERTPSGARTLTDYPSRDSSSSLRRL